MTEPTVDLNFSLHDKSRPGDRRRFRDRRRHRVGARRQGRQRRHRRPERGCGHGAGRLSWASAAADSVATYPIPRPSPRPSTPSSRPSDASTSWSTAPGSSCLRPRRSLPRGVGQDHRRQPQGHVPDVPGGRQAHAGGQARRRSSTWPPKRRPSRWISTSRIARRSSGWSASPRCSPPNGAAAECA